MEPHQELNSIRNSLPLQTSKHFVVSAPHPKYPTMICQRDKLKEIDKQTEVSQLIININKTHVQDCLFIKKPSLRER